MKRRNWQRMEKVASGGNEGVNFLGPERGEIEDK